MIDFYRVMLLLFQVEILDFSLPVTPISKSKLLIHIFHSLIILLFMVRIA